MCEEKKRIKGKYRVYDGRGSVEHPILTDNPREALWEANKFPWMEIKNICGERQFYKENGRWKMVPLE